MTDEQDDQKKTEDTQDSDEKTVYTAEELQSEVDRRVTQASESIRKKVVEEFEGKLEGERQKAEQEKLREKGKYKELFEETQGKLDALTTQLNAREHKEKAQAALSELGLGQLSGVLLASRDTVEDVASAGKTLKELFDKAVEIEVLQRLDTGERPGSTGQGTRVPPAKSTSEMNEKEKLAFIKEHGAEPYLERVVAQTTG